jgi:hypothetical protein
MPGMYANLFSCFLSLCIEMFFSNTKWILGFMQYSELRNDAVLGDKDIFFSSGS